MIFFILSQKDVEQEGWYNPTIECKSLIRTEPGFKSVLCKTGDSFKFYSLKEKVYTTTFMEMISPPVWSAVTCEE